MIADLKDELATCRAAVRNPWTKRYVASKAWDRIAEIKQTLKDMGEYEAEGA